MHHLLSQISFNVIIYEIQTWTCQEAHGWNYMKDVNMKLAWPSNLGFLKIHLDLEYGQNWTLDIGTKNQ
jgi:hypothetical protein